MYFTLLYFTLLYFTLSTISPGDPPATQPSAKGILTLPPERTGIAVCCLRLRSSSSNRSTQLILSTPQRLSPFIPSLAFGLTLIKNGILEAGWNLAQRFTPEVTWQSVSLDLHSLYPKDHIDAWSRMKAQPYLLRLWACGCKGIRRIVRYLNRW